MPSITYPYVIYLLNNLIKDGSIMRVGTTCRVLYY